ncbi:hypothetical protein EG68_05335 [Paragonimus skrjabini miyazakii]|uniref:Cilia- and flagella-associated protein 157 n=1 Tax=Paragonimus skrjabini miyazakii TaxID=59628 RepID=A0A8S9Z098_9TREM|nr:hypothetical protein EG68_05335 [Paragonimus skrjabini miyazakii]
MAKRKRSRNKNITPSSRYSSKLENPEIVDEFSHESCERQVDSLNKEIVLFQCYIDASKVSVEDYINENQQTALSKIDLISYLLNCVQRKDAEIEFRKDHLENLLSWIFLQSAAHEDRVAKLLLEIDMTKDRLSSEKAILTSLETTKVQRDDLEWKFREIKIAIEETSSENQNTYHQKNLTNTLEQDRLRKEMECRVIRLGEEFQRTTELRLANSQLKTLGANRILFTRLKQLGQRLVTVLGRNKSHHETNGQLKRDVEILRNVRSEMEGKFHDHLRSLQETIQACNVREAKLGRIYKSATVRTISEDRKSDLSADRLYQLQTRKKKLENEVGAKRQKWHELKSQNDQIKQMLTEDVVRLRKLCVSQDGLAGLIEEVKLALSDAQELFKQESVLNFTDRSHRKNRMLGAFFVLLHTTDQLCGQLAPNQLGIQVLNRADLPPASGPSTSFHSPTGLSTRSVSTISTHHSDRRLVSTLPDVPDLAEFGLIEVITSRKSSLTAELARELSAQSGDSLRREPTPWCHSVAIQATPESKNQTSEYVRYPNSRNIRMRTICKEAYTRPGKPYKMSNGPVSFESKNTATKTRLPSEKLLAEFRAPSSWLHASENRLARYLPIDSKPKFTVNQRLPNLNSLASL